MLFHHTASFVGIKCSNCKETIETNSDDVYFTESWEPIEIALEGDWSVTLPNYIPEEYRDEAVNDMGEGLEFVCHSCSSSFKPNTGWILHKYTWS